MSDESLLSIKKRRHNVLSLQKARYGIDCPPHVVIELEDLEREIATLERAGSAGNIANNQTNISGSVTGSVLSGNFNAPVTINTGMATQASAPSSAPSEQQVILAAFAQPQGLAPTEWEAEVRVLRDLLTPFSSRFLLDIIPNCTPKELFTTLLHRRPHLLHFQGHGTQRGLTLQDRLGDRHEIGWEALIRTLSSIESLRCVILNACNADVHAKLGAQHFHLITTPGSVSTEATRSFTTGFYTALSAGRSLPAAYRDGCNLSALEGIPSDQWPVLTEARSAS